MRVSSGIFHGMGQVGALNDYLLSQRGKATSNVVSRASLRTNLELVSQSWQGVDWHHDIVLQTPARTTIPGVAVLEITGGEVNSLDVGRARVACNALKIPVSTLFQIPNQPLWDRVEDDLIAHTLEQCLETGDQTWPLLFPMVQAVQGAMEALRQELGEDTQFILTGASKRGWTSWLAGLNLDGVMGIVPRVYDNLNVSEQMAGQVRLWGGYSPRIDDYTRRALQTTLENPNGKAMASSIDPYTYLSNKKVPVFIHLGSHDDYWRPDASRFYWDAIGGPKAILVLPNEGHGIGDAAWDKPGLIESLRWIAEGKPLPAVSMEVVENEIVFEFDAPIASWVAYRTESQTSWFGTSVWAVAGKGTDRQGTILLPENQRYEGYLVVAKSEDGTLFGLPPLITFAGQDLALDRSRKQ